MEKFLLGGFLTGDELDIIHQEQVGLPVLAPEFNVPAAFDGVDQFVGELIALDVDDVGVRIFLADAVGDGVEQMGLAHAGRAVDKQRIVYLPRGLGNGNGGGVGKPVGRAHHKIIKGKLRVKVHGRGGLALLLSGVQFLVAVDQKLGVGIENLLQSILNQIGAPAADDLPAKIRGGIENQVVFVQLHDLGIVQPGRDGDSPQALLNIAENLCPDIGG